MLRASKCAGQEIATVKVYKALLIIYTKNVVGRAASSTSGRYHRLRMLASGSLRRSPLVQYGGLQGVARRLQRDHTALSGLSINAMPAGCECYTHLRTNGELAEVG